MRAPSLPALAALLLSVTLPPPAGLSAQAGDGDGRAGWIGVGIQESLDCRARPDGRETPDAAPVVRARDCRRVLVTEAVLPDGPAAEAGVRPGDTLIAVNGQPVSERRGALELGELRPGQPVEVLVGRGEGRVSVRLTPEPRPAEQGPPPVLTPAGPGGASVFSPPGSVARVRPDAAAPPRVRIRVGGGDMPGTLRVDEEGRVYLEKGPDQLVRLRGVELPPPRVRALRDSALVEARQRLEALRERFRARAAAPSEPGWETESERIRMLGAEFLAMSSELAENLEGVDAGLLVLRVVPGTPAARLGLRPGDVVVEAGGRPVAGAGDLRSPFAGAVPGDSVVVRWMRRGEPMRGALQRR